MPRFHESHVVVDRIRGARFEICLLNARDITSVELFRTESRAAASRGIQLRAVLHGARRTWSSGQEVYIWTDEVARTLAEDGWAVRTLETAPLGKCIIIDNVAFTEVASGNAADPTAISYVDDALIFRLFQQDFDRAWSGASEVLFEDLPTGLSAPASVTAIAQVAESTYASLIARLAVQPNRVKELSPRQFEELVAELLTGDGFEVHLTPQTRDGGRDILAHLDTAAGRHLFYVECKQYKTRPVGVEVVRALYGTVIQERATAGLIVTTSEYTRDALRFAREIQHQMSLKDRDQLVAWLRRFRNAG